MTKTDMADYFIHPDRARQNCEGPFYGVDIGCDCACGIPEEIAPDLVEMGTRIEGYQSYFYRQPANEVEIAKAIEAINSCPIHDLRYGGKTVEIIKLLDSLKTDYRVSGSGIVEPSK